MTYCIRKHHMSVWGQLLSISTQCLPDIFIENYQLFTQLTSCATVVFVVSMLCCAISLLSGCKIKACSSTVILSSKSSLRERALILQVFRLDSKWTDAEILYTYWTVSAHKHRTSSTHVKWERREHTEKNPFNISIFHSPLATSITFFTVCIKH